ncbi:peptidylprolyl isomerase [Consotaella aegiceratis]|uniref:peptidylprolyl isomerase n=1 Tax=Consotaella aegiceratis TaxID=3097961 RepID=UPI002F42C53E
MAHSIAIEHAPVEKRVRSVMPSACESGGCGGAPSPRRPAPPVFSDVFVNGAEIAPEAIAREMQHHPAENADAAWTAAASALVIRHLLLEEARRLDPTRALPGEGADDEALIATLLDREVEPALPTDTECRRVYEAERQRFRTADLLEASHVLIEPESDDDEAWTAAREHAAAIIGQVRDDDAAFAEAARAFSRCPSARQNGSLGQIRRGELVREVEGALFSLYPGTTAPQPVRSRFGWHVVRLHRRIEGETLPFEVMKPKIAEMLAARAWTVAASRLVARLVEAAEIEGVVVEPEIGR